MLRNRGPRVHSTIRDRALGREQMPGPPWPRTLTGAPSATMLDSSWSSTTAHLSTARACVSVRRPPREHTLWCPLAAGSRTLSKDICLQIAYKFTNDTTYPVIFQTVDGRNFASATHARAPSLLASLGCYVLTSALPPAPPLQC